MATTGKKVVLVTGTSSGIGLALVQRLRDCGRYRVVATAREGSLGKLVEAGVEEGETLLVRALDVTRDVEREAVIAEIEARWGGVDVLVNNAGISFRAVIEHLHETDLQLQLAVNCIGPMELIRRVLPGMRDRRWGRIINISSVGGMMAMPTMGGYSASKFALEGASEALWYEMRPWNVRVSLVQPGFVRSDSFEKVYFSADASRAVDSAVEYGVYYDNMGRFIARLMRRAFATPDSIARRIVAVMDQERPRLRVPATIDAYFFYLIRRWLPRKFYHWLLYRNLPNIDAWGESE